MQHVPLSNIGPDTFAPRYLAGADLPWLGVLLEEVERFAGRPRGELASRLREPLSLDVPPWKLRLAGRVLLGLDTRGRRPSIDARVVRRTVFGEAARGAAREAVFARAAERLGVDAATVEAALFADLAPLRPVAAVGADLGPEELARRVNLALVQAVVARTRAIRIRVTGGARDLVRHAQREGLLCTVRPTGAADGYHLEISGPLALFRSTAMYARALAGLVPRLAWCEQYALQATYSTGKGYRTVVVRSGDPIAQRHEPVRFDRALERRFVDDFARCAPGWAVIPEPEPVPAGDTLIFPDFALVPPDDAGRPWLVEIVGFWTPGYLVQKLERMRAADLPRLIVCVDRARACAAEELPAGARVVRFRGRIDPREVLAATSPP